MSLPGPNYKVVACRQSKKEIPNKNTCTVGSAKPFFYFYFYSPDSQESDGGPNT